MSRIKEYKVVCSDQAGGENVVWYVWADGPYEAMKNFIANHKTAWVEYNVKVISRDSIRAVEKKLKEQIKITATGRRRGRGDIMPEGKG